MKFLNMDEYQCCFVFDLEKSVFKVFDEENMVIEFEEILKDLFI